MSTRDANHARGASSALVVVAHPDDETLWVGGTMLMHPDWRWRVLSLCRGDDPDRRPRFFSAMTRLGSQGSIGDLDDGPDQVPLADDVVQGAIRRQLEQTDWDVLVTHSPFGEYTRHLRHEEVGRAVLDLWQGGELTTRQLRMFAYADGAAALYPAAIASADLVVPLPADVCEAKRALIEEVYGFAADSWEARCTPRTEAFWCFERAVDALAWQAERASNP